MLYGDRSGAIRENTEKSLKLAALLFPDETWIYKEPNIYVAESRLIEERREKAKWEREMSQVRILTGRGSVAYFLPERQKENDAGVLSADTIIDGEIVEIKTVSGTRVTLGHEFKKGYKQGAALVRQWKEPRSHSVFIRLLSDLSIGSVRAKIAGELKERLDPGMFICYFDKSAELHCWPYEELRGLIRR
jgi:hypothetical protein